MDLGTRRMPSFTATGVETGVSEASGVSRGVTRPGLPWWRVDPTGRFTVDHNGRPLFWMADNAHGLVVNVTLSDADLYFADRASSGFAATWVNLLCNTNTGGRSDSSTFDGLLPFTVAGDLSTPNPAYFARADYMLRQAAAYGLYVFLDPIDTTDYITTMESNLGTKCFNYGVYLGTRYRTYPNIIWLHGDDFQTWNSATTYGGLTDSQLALQVLKGIQSVSPLHLHTCEHNYYLSDTLQDANWSGFVALNAVYSYYQYYERAYVAYNRTVGSLPVPTFLVEANYENTPNTQNANIETSGTGNISLVVLRRQAWWAILCGSTGHFYGNRPLIHQNTSWQTTMQTPGLPHMQLHQTFFKSLPWWTLVPDQTHVVATAGYGTFNADNTVASYSSGTAVTTGRTPDGKTIVCYLANAVSTGALTLDMTKLATSTITAQWFDPTNGAYSSAGTGLTNTGTQTFTKAVTNNAGDPDWVLLLTAT